VHQIGRPALRVGHVGGTLVVHELAQVAELVLLCKRLHHGRQHLAHRAHVLLEGLDRIGDRLPAVLHLKGGAVVLDQTSDAQSRQALVALEGKKLGEVCGAMRLVGLVCRASLDDDADGGDRGRGRVIGDDSHAVAKLGLVEASSPGRVCTSNRAQSSSPESSCRGGGGVSKGLHL